MNEGKGPLKDESRASLVRLVDSVLDSVRELGGPDLHVVAELAADAARWWSERTAIPLPELLASTEDHPHLRRAAQLQKGWLQEADAAAIVAYLPTLGYRLGAEMSGEFLSSSSMVQVALTSALARLRAGTGPLTIFDLAAGAGSMLGELASAVAEQGYTPRVIGQELDRDLARIAAANLFLRGHQADIRTADSLTQDLFATEGVDLAVSQPPFGLSWSDRDQQVRQRHREQSWYPFGFPYRGDATWLFASRSLEKLRLPEAGGGRAVVFVAPGALTNDSSNSVRQAVLNADLLEAVIALPGGLSPATRIPLYALIFANSKAATRMGKVQVINLRPYFETSRDRRSTQRELQADAFEVLRQSLASVRDSTVSRTLPTDYFMRRRVSVTAVQRTSTAPRAAPLEWEVEIPQSQDTESFLRERYGQQIPVSWQPREHMRARLEVDSVFDPSRQRLKRWLRDRGWEFTRLSALIASVPRIAEAGGASDKPLLMLPTGAQPALVGTDLGDHPGRVLAVELTTGLVLTEFLSSWLSTSHGRESRRRALDHGTTGTGAIAVRTDERSLFSFADELIVPIPPLSVQQGLATAEARLTAVASMADRARRELWEDPGRGKQVVSRFNSLFDETLGAWANDLPYPVASAVWTLETRSTIDAKHKQVFLVWEAYAAFTGTVVLSALAQDPALRETELPPLREALANAAVSMERATLGAWNVITQRLSARFRALLDSNELDERARVLQIFGGPTYDTLMRILSPKTVQLLTDANAKRNEWSGHGGAATERELQDQLDYLTARLGELRDEVGSAWRELHCVRAGEGWRGHGQIHQKVEVAMGTSTPFRQSEIRVGELMDRGDLYLATDGCARPLRLQHLLVLRQSPDNARYAAYFYNRMQGKKVRIVSYHLADHSDIIEEMEDVADAVHDLVGTPQPLAPRSAHNDDHEA